MPLLRGCAALLVLALAGCASAPRAPPERSYSGRFVAAATSGEQRNSVSGLFIVEIRGSQQLIELATPVGTTLARIEIEPGRARVTDGKLQGLSGPNADGLVEQALGWPLPIGGLPYWLEGRPDPGRGGDLVRGADGGRQIEQDGWVIRISETSEAGRPRRLQLDRPADRDQPAVSLRLIVDEQQSP
ncbi:MAG TPA: outer membrane lipoprotein LolB [Burkholderiaceae bacterium]|nr:outer membrane lipoprotein LolB [Burkholderiaceae bacterium]